MCSETERLSLKILKSDKMALRQLAKIEGEPMSTVVRRIIRQELQRRELIRPHILKAQGSINE